jgi:biopolymer transport protein ExbB
MPEATTTAAATAALTALAPAAPAPVTAFESVDGAAHGSFLTEHLSRFFNTVGAEWVLWILLALSVASVAVMIDRFLYLRKRRGDNDALARDIDRALAEGKPEAARAAAAAAPSVAGAVIAEAMRHYADGPNAVEESVAGAIARERPKLDRGLAFLGTLGNNAPFIGLFGTVLGIIRSFADLARHGAASGASSVMAGIAEALVATAVGLLVAIPAVMSYNWFQRRIKADVTQAQAMAHVILARMSSASGRAEAAAAAVHPMHESRNVAAH